MGGNATTESWTEAIVTTSRSLYSKWSCQLKLVRQWSGGGALCDEHHERWAGDRAGGRVGEYEPGHAALQEDRELLDGS